MTVLLFNKVEFTEADEDGGGGAIKELTKSPEFSWVKVSFEICCKTG